MELLLGETLADRLTSVAVFPVDYATGVLKQIAAGLGAAHVADIVHGDLKPENIVFTGAGEDSRVVVTDFGLAFALGRETGSDGKGEHPRKFDERSTPPIMGTPAYMAPELGHSLPSRSSDVFAFGLVALEMLTGHRRWKSTTTVLQQSKSTPLITPHGLLRARRLAATLPPRLGSLVQACLEADPDDRPASAGEILEHLEPRPPSMTPDHSWRADIGGSLPSRANWPFERLLNSDGDCQIWLARHNKTEEPRVFKLCTEDAEPAVLLRELTLLRLLRTELGRRDDLDRVLDWHLEGPTRFLEMEYSSAGDLVEWAKSLGGLQDIPLRTRLELAAGVAEALAAIHEVGIAHDTFDRGLCWSKNTKRGIGEAHRVRPGSPARSAPAADRRHHPVGPLELGCGESRPRHDALVDPETLFPVRDGMPSPRQDVGALGELLFRLAVGDLTQQDLRWLATSG